MQMAMTVECVKEYLSQVAGILDAHHPMGSERRLAHWKREPEKDSRWKCPDGIRRSLVERSHIRMILVSPAPFSEGWLPGWLKQKEEGIIGTPPGCEVKLRLVSAVTGRWQPISGWAIEQGKPQGPKALRRMVPAGSVYFFETIGGSAGSLAEIWLKSVCDDEQDRSDGFGLALWGIW
ncbi:MAG: hypothetical protein CVV55_04945 [Synergistetes bacterium HGW-Synergistetes-2]|nr:MAG: hypothetical protein CVV55_04945 [Synergistetes bacterium HGW-Synergistetes-2]